MLEIRYDKTTNLITGWWGSRFGNEEIKLKNRSDEAIAMLDISIPDKPLGAWLYDEVTQSLTPNPAYIPPEPARDLAAEIDKLKDEVKALKDK